MQILSDCTILEYCHSTPEERLTDFERAAADLFKPVHQLPVFELCHALHILVKHYQISPSQFRAHWVEFCEKHFAAGEFFIHMPEDQADQIFQAIIGLPHQLPAEDTAPCEDPRIYWGNNRHLIYRMKSTYVVDVLEGWWSAIPPDGQSNQPLTVDRQSSDVVLDANNLVELLNQLPSDGYTAIGGLTFPTRLSEEVRRMFRQIIDTRGVAGKFIVPISALEEAEWVIHRPQNEEKYRNARQVLRSIALSGDHLLWNFFSFEGLNQDIFEYFLYLYERLEIAKVSFDDFDDFGDFLVLAHGLYHGCRIASNEWFEYDPQAATDVWVRIKEIFPFLVVERE